MRIPLAIAASLASLAATEPAPATTQASAPPPQVSDTAGAAEVHGELRAPERWHCTPAGCAGAPGASSSSALGFAAAALAALGFSRGHPPGSR